MAIKINFYELRQRHEHQNGGFRIPLLQMSKEIGIPYSTMHRWHSGTVTRFDAHVLEKLCAYFDCEVGDLLEYAPDDTK